MGQSPDPDHPELGLRWILPYTRDVLCTCTKILFGGINSIPIPGFRNFHYLDGDPLSLVNTDNVEDIQQILGCVNGDATGKNSKKIAYGS